MRAHAIPAGDSRMPTPPPHPTREAGFSMVEALICLMLLGVLAAIAAAFLPSVRTATEVAASAQTLDLARAKIEELQASPATALAGDDTLVVDGARFVRTWRSEALDLDGDGTAESDAYRVAVEMGGIALETIRIAPPSLDVLVR